MTVAAGAYKGTASWTGVENSFNPNISAQDITHIVVSYTNAAGVTVPLSHGVHLTLAKAGGAGESGAITATPIAGAMPPASGTLTFTRVTPDTQSVDFDNLNGYSPQVHEGLHDQRALRTAELSGRVSDVESAVASLALLTTGNPSFSFKWSTNTGATDPTNTYVKGNNAALASITSLFISETAIEGAIAGFLTAMFGSTAPVKATILLSKASAPTNWAAFDITAQVDNGAWRTLTATALASSGAFAQDDALDCVIVRNNAGSGDVLRANNLSDLASLKTAYDNLSIRGADIASAATVNLDNATGNYVNITGTTTITAITLADGRERTVRFMGALTLTHGALLALPGAANIVTAADDIAVFRGTAAGAVRCVQYQRAANGPETFATALSVTNNTASTSQTTGALKVAGGLGVLGQLNVGSINVGGGTYDATLLPSLQALNNFESAGTAPAFQMKLTTGAADSKYWDWIVTTGQMGSRALNDTYTAASNWLDVYRTTTNIDAVVMRAGSSVEQLRVATGNHVYFPALGTTASAANAFLNSGSSPVNELLRSTSSLEYKRDVENVGQAYADAILQLQPIWYRSKATADNPDWSWYGLGAEDVAAIDPRLVHWGFQERHFEEVAVPEKIVVTVDDGWEETPSEEYVEVGFDEYTGERTFKKTIAIKLAKKTKPEERTYYRKERRLKEGAEKVPDGVMYDRIAVLLLDVVKREREARLTLEGRIADLEAAILAKQ